MYAKKLDIIEEMGKFLKTYNLSRPNHDGIEVGTEEGEAVVRNLPEYRIPGADGFPCDHHRHPGS